MTKYEDGREIPEKRMKRSPKEPLFCVAEEAIIIGKNHKPPQLMTQRTPWIEKNPLEWKSERKNSNIVPDNTIRQVESETFDGKKFYAHRRFSLRDEK